MAGLVPATHRHRGQQKDLQRLRLWVPGTSPGMTVEIHLAPTAVFVGAAGLGSGSPLAWLIRKARTSSTSVGFRNFEKLTMPLWARTPWITTELKSSGVVIISERLRSGSQEPVALAPWQTW